MTFSKSAELEKLISEGLPVWIERQPGLRRRLRHALEETRDKPPGPMTYEEFLDWAGDIHAEWVDGEVIIMSPVSFRHQNLADFLTAILRAYVETKELGIVCSAPFQMKTAQGREPDLLFVAQENLSRVKTNFLDGPADLVIEIISPESIGRDRGQKFTEYEAAGIPEYWLIDPIRQEAEFYQLNERGRYRLASPTASGQYHSPTIEGLWLQVDWLWQDTLPPVLDILREWQLI